MTKLNSILFAVLYCTALTAFGQSKIDIGAEGGPSLIFLRGNDTYPPAAGFSGGVSFQCNFGKTISLRTGLSYERKGASIKTYTPTFVSFGKKNSAHHYDDYLIVPILVRASFGEKIQGFINVGPYFGYLLQDYAVFKGPDSPKQKFYGSGDVKKFDMGVSAGFGIFVPLGEKFALTVELRNNLGLYNIEGYQSYNGVTLKTNSTNLLLGFAYRIGT